MTLNEAMHAECSRCGEAAMNHRMTGSGNFYCLEPNWQNRWIKSVYPIITDRKAYLASRAKCQQLIKSPLPKAAARIIKEQWQSASAITDVNQMELA